MRIRLPCNAKIPGVIDAGSLCVGLPHEILKSDLMDFSSDQQDDRQSQVDANHDGQIDEKFKIIEAPNPIEAPIVASSSSN